MDFSFFKDFYFMHCFSKEEHRNDFNSGINMYINSVQYFHDLKDEFQRDLEGVVIKQAEGNRGYLLCAKSDLNVDEAINKAINNKLQDGEWILQTSDCKLYINGYIFCLTIIPKYYFEIRDNMIVFNEKHNIANELFYLLNQYTKDSKYTFLSLYDAEKFMEIFFPQMTDKGYIINYGCVDYEKLSEKQRCELYKEGNIDKLIFTKDPKYNYQHEFRIFLNKPHEKSKDHIEEQGVKLQSSVLYDLAYLSPEYVKEIEGVKNEI